MIDYTKMYSQTQQMGYDVGLRAYMLKIYNYMAIALAITGIAGYATFAWQPLTSLIYNIGPYGQLMGYTGFGTLMMFAPLAVVFYFSFNAMNMDIEKSKVLLWIYSALTGISLSSLAFVYTGESIVRTFFITSSVFAAMSIYGYTTQKDLTAFGSFLVMGLIGVVVTSLINLFFKSPAVEFATSLLSVGIFIGLIAWDTQKLKAIYFSASTNEVRQRMAVVGALNLYLDFINLFVYLLRFLGTRKNND